jgi:hypothetical protein
LKSSLSPFPAFPFPAFPFPASDQSHHHGVGEDIIVQDATTICCGRNLNLNLSLFRVPT